MTHVEKLPGCKDKETIAKLKQANDEFKRIKSDIIDEGSENNSLESATNIKRIIIGIINNDLVVYLRGMLRADETKYSLFAKDVEQIIKEINEAGKRRNSKESKLMSN